jgi:hypothetical protein
MSELHDLIQTRQWKTVRRALRLDTSVAMRIDDSPAEDHRIATARTAAWLHRSGGIPSREEEARCDKKVSPEPPRSIADSNEEESHRVRYWVPRAHDRDTSSMGQRRTLLHSICTLEFYSEEASLYQRAYGGGDELRDWRDVLKTVEMIIDASHNELRPLKKDDDYYEELEEGMDKSAEINRLVSSFSSTCRNCSCYYQSQYCPPVELDPVERYHDNNVHSVTNHASERILHTSVLTMPDNLGATPLHLLTGEGSAHVDMVSVFLDKCRTLDSTTAKHDEPRAPGWEEDRRRPTLHDLMSAQNGHGCTPVHFLCGKSSFGEVSTGFRTLEEFKDAQVLALILVQFYDESIVNDQCGIVHPLLIQDVDGDLPLHYATNTGASVSFLSLLTEYHPGTSRATLVRNAEGRLPVDEVILWYKELIVPDHEWENRRRRDSDDEYENRSEDDENESSNENDDNEDYSEDDDSSESSHDVKREEHETEHTLEWNGNPEAMIEWIVRSMLSTSREKSSAEDVKATNVSLSSRFALHLWDRWRVLIQAGVNSIASDAKGTTAFRLSPETWKMETHQKKSMLSSVILTKYFDFPALTLVASILMTTDTSEPLLEKDSCGLLPLHLACGKIAHLLSLSEKYPVSTCKATVHWNTTQLPCSMIRYLLHLCPESARVPTREGRLPLHLFLDGGYDERCRKDDQNSSKQAYIWDDVKELLKVCPDALRTPDVNSHLYPFQAAAAATAETSSLLSDEERCSDQQGTRRVKGTRLTSLEVTSRLILEDPSLCRFVGNRAPNTIE